MKTESGEPEEATQSVNQFGAARPTVPLFPHMLKAGTKADLAKAFASTYCVLTKAGEDIEAASNQGALQGRQQQPVNIPLMMKFLDSNEHHQRCIEVKTAATVGLGYRDPDKHGASPLQKQKVNPPGVRSTSGAVAGGAAALFSGGYTPTKVDKVLSPLCRFGWYDAMYKATMDYFICGNGYLEVVRNPEGKVLGIYHIPAANTYVTVANLRGDFFYEVDGLGIGGTRYFSRWGNPVIADPLTAITATPDGTSSQVIHFRMPSSRSIYYGYPNWLSAIASIELGQMSMQYKYDFFLNRGVPEFMLFITGATLGPKEFKVVEDALKGTIGLGGSHKTIALNISDEKAKIQVEKLALGSTSDDTGFIELNDSLALRIVSIHGVPPLLAGITVPGKMSSTNELPNALMAFQQLVVGQAQTCIQHVLADTLGSDDAGLGLNPEDFQFRTILDDINMQQMQTMTNMRQPLADAQAQGRNLNDGLKP